MGKCTSGTSSHSFPLRPSVTGYKSSNSSPTSGSSCTAGCPKIIYILTRVYSPPCQRRMTHHMFMKDYILHLDRFFCLYIPQFIGFPCRCVDCLKGTQHQTISRYLFAKAKRALERVGADIAGPMKCPDTDKYLFVIVDHYTRDTWNFPREMPQCRYGRLALKMNVVQNRCYYRPPMQVKDVPG